MPKRLTGLAKTEPGAALCGWRSAYSVLGGKKSEFFCKNVGKKSNKLYIIIADNMRRGKLWKTIGGFPKTCWEEGVRMKRAFCFSGFLAFVFGGLIGCASTVPMSSNVNDSVLMGIRTNSNTAVSYQFTSQVTDGEMKFYTANRGSINDGHQAANVTESAALNKMLGNYLESKFLKIGSGNNVTIEVELQDFWMEGYMENGGSGTSVAVFFGAGEYITINSKYSANIKALVKITKDGEEYSKVLQVSADDIHSGHAQPQAGEIPWQTVAGLVINSANNKLLLLLNAYFEEIGL